MNRLDEVISKYAVMQDRSEEDERQKRRARLLGTSSQSPGSPKACLDSGEVWKGQHLSERSCLHPALATRASRGLMEQCVEAWEEPSPPSGVEICGLPP